LKFLHLLSAFATVISCVITPVAAAGLVLTPPATFGQAGGQAEKTLLSVYYAGNGLWRDCDSVNCQTENQDWGADSATYALFLRWKTTHSTAVAPVMSALIGTATTYGPACAVVPCSSWSDIPAWDAIALMREFEVTGSNDAVRKAKIAFQFLKDAKVFGIGACPSISYQVPGGKPGYWLKTLETDANYIKAALLLYGATHDRAYLRAAVDRYGAVRRQFLDQQVPLYTTYVFDDRTHCAQLPHRFFASVNGDMIWSGVWLKRYTGVLQYNTQAVATAKAVDSDLSDSRGVFADLQAENDVQEPLVEAMYDLAAEHGQAFARAWLLRNAAAAISERRSDGAYGRFWDGPPTRASSVSIWQSNGGIALEFAAAALASSLGVPAGNAWSGRQFVARPTLTLPSTISFDGTGIALIGPMGDACCTIGHGGPTCCQAGHSRVSVDGVETFDHTGIWQKKSMTGSVENMVLFAWRWPTTGHHIIRNDPGTFNAKEGGPSFKLDGFIVNPR
jgi:hypothetical protein